MRVLLDEDVPRRLKREIIGHEASTVVESGWSGVKNGILLGLAGTAGFDVFLTCDRNLQHQQNLNASNIAIIVIAVPDKRMETILPLASGILCVLAENPQPGTVSVVGSWQV